MSSPTSCRNPLPIKSGSVARDFCCRSIPTPNTGSDMPAPYWPIVGPTATLVAYSSITCWRFVGSPQHGDTHSFPPLHGDGPQSARHCMLYGWGGRCRNLDSCGRCRNLDSRVYDYRPNITRAYSRATGFSRLEGDKFPVVFWKNPENSRCKINDLFTCKHIYYCQKVANTDSFLPTA